MKFGLFTVSMPEYDIENTVRALKELGYDGVEWRVGNPPPKNRPDSYSFENRYWSYNLSTLDIGRINDMAPEIRNMCAAAGLEICSLTTYLGIHETEAARNIMKAADIIGCKNIRINVPSYDGKINYRELFGSAQKHLETMERLAASHNVKVNFETHMGNIIPSASAAYRFVSGFDPKYVGIIFDPGNMVYEGFENYRLGIELLGEYLAHVHVKNGCWKYTGTGLEGAEVWKPTWASFKKGYADIPGLVRILKETGYEGYVSVEDFSNDEDTYTKLKNNIEFLRSIQENSLRS